MHKCEFCETILSNQYSLKIHQKTAKYCLEKQGITLSDNFKCEFCDHVTTSLYNLNSHKSNCKDKIMSDKLEIEKLKHEICVLNVQLTSYKNLVTELQNKLENIAIKAATKSTNVTNNTSNNNCIIANLSPLIVEDIKKDADKLTIEHVKKGAIGYAEFVLEFPFKDKLVCVDYSRRKVKFKNKDGDVITDPNLVKLAPLFFDAIWRKNAEITNKFCVELIGEQVKACKDQSKILEHEISRILDIKESVTHASEGKSNDFHTNWTNAICSKLVSTDI